MELPGSENSDEFGGAVGPHVWYVTTVALIVYYRPMPDWVLLAYRLPREPSTPRITLWRKLNRLGAAKIADGLVALPLDSRTREQFEWLANDVIEAAGEATIWVGKPEPAAQERALARAMFDAIAIEYAAVSEEAAAALDDPANVRKRTLARLRRELRRIRARDYFPPPERERVLGAVELLAGSLEVVEA